MQYTTTKVKKRGDWGEVHGDRGQKHECGELRGDRGKKNMVVAVTTLQMTSLWGRTSETRTERNKRFAEGFNYH